MNLKNLTFAIALTAAGLQSSAQDLIYDAIATGIDIPQSTRLAGMGGAGTLFGGDLSSFVINPAGLSMSPEYFTLGSSDFGGSWHISLSGDYKGTDANYNNNDIDASPFGNLNVNFGWIGSWNKGVAFGFSFAKIVDFKTAEMSVTSDNPSNSIATMFNEPYQGYNRKYHNLLSDAEVLNIPNTSTHHECSQTWEDARRKGGIYSLTIPFSFRIKKVLFVGISASFNYLRARDTCSIYERSSWSNDWSYIPDGDKTDGYAFSMKGGVVFSPVKYFAVGAAYHPKTNYKVKNRYAYQITNESNNEKKYMSDSLTYHLETPSKLVLSGAIILPHYGSFCADMEYTDYSQGKYSTKDGDFIYWDGDNDEIKRRYRPAKNYHFGTEIVINSSGINLQAAFIRLGYSMYGNPYKNIGKDIDRTTMSFGFGFAFEKWYLDIAASYTKTDTERYLYHWQNVAAQYSLKQKHIAVMASVKFTFNDNEYEDFM